MSDKFLRYLGGSYWLFTCPTFQPPSPFALGCSASGAHLLSIWHFTVSPPQQEHVLLCRGAQSLFSSSIFHVSLHCQTGSQLHRSTDKTFSGTAFGHMQFSLLSTLLSRPLNTLQGFLRYWFFSHTQRQPFLHPPAVLSAPPVLLFSCAWL